MCCDDHLQMRVWIPNAGLHIQQLRRPKHSVSNAALSNKTITITCICLIHIPQQSVIKVQ